MKNKKTLISIFLTAIIFGSNAPVSFAITDPDYLEEKTQISQEQSQDLAEARVGILSAQSAMQAQLETNLIAPDLTALPAIDSPSANTDSSQTPSASTGSTSSSSGKVLGISKTRQQETVITQQVVSQNQVYQQQINALQKSISSITQQLNDLNKYNQQLQASVNNVTPANDYFYPLIVTLLISIAAYSLFNELRVKKLTFKKETVKRFGKKNN